MATWITHLRIAEQLLASFDFEKQAFLVGNVGPDCGVQSETGYSFTPDKTITHWQTPKAGIINPEAFYEAYLLEPQGLSEEASSFLYGYYVHLLTDVAWTHLFNKQLQDHPDWKKKVKEEEDFIWVIKRDWYGNDYNYLDQLPKESCLPLFFQVRKVKDYLDYFPKNALTTRVKFIQDYYKYNPDQIVYTGEYLTQRMMDAFVKEVAMDIKLILQEKMKTS